MAMRKEPHFFDNDGLDWDDPPYERYHAGFLPPTAATLAVGEATPILTYWPACLERVAAYNPSAKFIVLLRHPAHRAFSQWRVEVHRHRETLSFSEAVGAVGRQRVASAPGGVHRRYSYVERSLYAEQVRSLLRLFPPEQLIFVRTDRLWRETQRTMHAIFGFLGMQDCLAYASAPYIVPRKIRSLAAPHPGEIGRLTAFFREDIEYTQALTGLDLVDWLDPAYSENIGPIETAPSVRNRTANRLQSVRRAP